VARLLFARGAAPVCLVRRRSDLAALPDGAVRREGDLDDAASLDRWLAGCRSLVYCASMGFGHVPGVLAACERAGVGRVVFVSTTALFTGLPAPSKAVRTAAEDAVRSSALRATIVRPTMIYGARGDRNVERLLRFVTRWPVVPVPGDGASLVQPVHVDDLAAAIVEAWARDVAVGRAYALSGAAPLALDAVIDAAAAACGRRRRKLHLPLGPVAWLLGAVEALGLRPRIRREQVLRLAEDKAFAHDDAARDLGFAPREFAVGVREEARALGLATP
jgi:nucleoside-diphosphate-sugar epimerase